MATLTRTPQGTRACPNCGALAPHDYCPRCGQEQSEEAVPAISQWIREALDELLLVEARLPRTLKRLFWPPGELWAEWRRGRRASYVSPLRTYLLAAIPFFLLVSTVEYQPVGGNLFHIIVEGVYYGAAPERIRVEVPDVPVMAPLPDSVRNDSVQVASWRAEFERRRALRQSYREALQRRLAEGARRVAELLPVLVGVIMVPWLALLLGFDPRRNERFASRLVGSLHIHAVGYVFAMLAWPLGFAVPAGLLAATIYLGLATYRVGPDAAAGAVVRVVITPVSYVVCFLATYVGLVYALMRFAPGWVFNV
ncbi:MAG: DUF3667 domain-containing protein [Gemmatimonadota bacterium]